MSAPTIPGPAPAAADVPLDDLDTRRPRPARRRRRWLLLAAGLGIVIVLAAVVWAVWFSSLLAVQDVRVVGAEGDRATAVAAAAAIPTGQPIARIDADAAEQAVLGLPWVATAEVRRGWPHEIVLAVTVRTPIALVDDGAGRAAVDAEGVVFTPAGQVPKGLPRVRAEGVGLNAAMAVLAGLPADLSRKVVSLTATTRDDVDLTLRSGDVVHWGSADDSAFKAEVLRALLKRKADVYDVSAPELPTTFRSA
jgi:cell division protein FtsQ